MPKKTSATHSAASLAQISARIRELGVRVQALVDAMELNEIPPMEFTNQNSYEVGIEGLERWCDSAHRALRDRIHHVDVVASQGCPNVSDSSEKAPKRRKNTHTNAHVGESVS